MNLLSSLGVLDFVEIITTIILIYVAHFYYKYLTRVNPNPLLGAIPLPLVGDLLGIIYQANVIEDVEKYIELLLNGFDDFIFALTFSPFVKYIIMKKRNQIMINNIKMVEKITGNIINHRREEIEKLLLKKN